MYALRRAEAFAPAGCRRSRGSCGSKILRVREAAEPFVSKLLPYMWTDHDGDHHALLRHRRDQLVVLAGLRGPE
jgi:hypothetical protein